MISPIEICILLIYLSFAIDLLGFPVPSEASTYQLFFPKEKLNPSTSTSFLAKVQNLSLVAKFGLLLIPSFIGIFSYLLPLLVILLPFLENYFGELVTDQRYTLTIVGIVIALLGRLLSIKSAIDIRKKEQTTTNLKTKQFFKLSRNPILLGLHICFIGLLLIYPVWMMFLGGTVYFLNMHFKVLLEEHFLKEKFGDSFIQYCQTTNRYL